MAPSSKRLRDQDDVGEDFEDTSLTERKVKPRLSKSVSNGKRKAEESETEELEQIKQKDNVKQEPDDAINDEDGMDIEDDIDQANKSEAEIGIIEEVELVNFMTHKHTLVKFEPNTNFVTGVNGAGKSAILTGIIVCLGGKAAATNRGNSVKHFIRTGESVASVMVGLRNRGYEAFKPEVYGPTIYIERILKKEGSMSYHVKNSKKKVIAKTKDEVNAILDHMNIQVDNPITVLGQDTAREFMKSNDPKKKYDYFMKGTQLEELFQHISYIEEQRTNIKHTVDRKMQDLREAKERVVELQRKLETMKKLRELRSSIDQKKLECAWAIVHQKELEMAHENKEVEKLKGKMRTIENKLQQDQAQVALAGERIEQIQAELNAKKGAVDPTIKERKQVDQELQALNAERRNLFNNSKDAEKQIKAADDEIKRIDADIANETKRLNIDTSKDKLLKEQEIEKLQANLQRISQAQKDNHRNREAMEREEREASEAVENAQSRTSDLKRQRDECDRRIKALRAQQENKLRFFGDNMPNFLQEIERSRRQFDKPVTGPIGIHVQLLESRWAWPVQNCLRPVLNAFIVHTKRDMQTLRNLLDKYKMNNRVILNADNEGLASDVFVNQPDESIPTVMRVIKFDNIVAHQAFVDQVHIERSALVETTPEAQSLMRRRPRNVMVAYTMDGAEIKISANDSISLNNSGQHGRSLFGDVEQNIRNDEHERERLTGQIHEAEADLRRLLQDRNQKASRLKELEKEGYRLQKEEPTTRIRLSHLQEEIKAILETQPSMISAYEAEKERFITEKNLYVRQYRDLVDQIKAAEKRIQPVKEQIANIDKKIDEMKREAEQIQTQLEQAIQQKFELETAAVNLRRKIAEHQAKIDEATTRITGLGDTVKAAVDAAIALAEQLQLPSTRIETQALPKDLEKEITTNMRILTQQEHKQGNLAETEQLYQTRLQSYQQQKKDVNTLIQFEKLLTAASASRLLKTQDYQTFLALRAKHIFKRCLQIRNFRGKLEFNHEEKKLHLSVQSKQTVLLSGGERSYTTVAFLLALWDGMPNPFRALDEFDVCMDEVNRHISTMMILDAAKDNMSKQFIIISPRSISSVRPEHKSIVNVVEVVKDNA